MRTATKHYLFFAILLVSLALLVAFVLWHWRQAQADAAVHRVPRSIVKRSK